jgi:hypothetical protein
MNLSIAGLKRMLPVGTEFTAEFCGDVNMVKAGKLITRRKVTRQTGDMVSEFLDGPDTGKEIYLNWKGVKARMLGEDDDNTIILTQPERGDFLKITDLKHK